MNIERQSAFMVISCEHPIYHNYDQISEDKRDTVIPLVILLNRWDGKIGFLGGYVDEGEEPLHAAIREVKEEAGYEITEEKIKNIKFVCKHVNNGTESHLFSLSVNFEEFKDILYSQQKAVHFLTEGSLYIQHFINYSHAKSFNNFLKHNFSPSVKEEIKDLIKFLGWDKRYDLTINF